MANVHSRQEDTVESREESPLSANYTLSQSKRGEMRLLFLNMETMNTISMLTLTAKISLQGSLQRALKEESLRLWKYTREKGEFQSF